MTRDYSGIPTYTKNMFVWILRSSWMVRLILWITHKKSVSIRKFENTTMSKVITKIMASIVGYSHSNRDMS
jgi:hypothetical protein